MPMPQSRAPRAGAALFLGAALALAAASPALCQKVRKDAPPPPSRAAHVPVRMEDVRAALSVLAADSMEGRGTGTPGSARAARYIVGELRRFGVEPAGDSAYFQRVPLVRVGARGMRLARAGDADTVPAERRFSDVNIVGIIRGSDPALRDEVVVVGSHYDHMGIGRAVNGDSIYNGADDDASGTVAVLEVARALAKSPPRRSVLFVVTTAEEAGMIGTQWFVRNPTVPVERMVAQLQVEMIGRPDSLAGGPGRGWLTGYERSTMGELLAAAGIPVVPDARPQMSFFTRSDNIVFARAGIPAHTFSSYGMHGDYHQPSDEIGKVDFDHMTRLVDAAVRAARVLADGPAPRWNPGGRPTAPQNQD